MMSWERFVSWGGRIFPSPHHEYFILPLDEFILYLQTQEIVWSGESPPSLLNYGSEEGLTKYDSEVGG